MSKLPWCYIPCPNQMRCNTIPATSILVCPHHVTWQLDVRKSIKNLKSSSNRKSLWGRASLQSHWNVKVHKYNTILTLLKIHSLLSDWTLSFSNWLLSMKTVFVMEYCHLFAHIEFTVWTCFLILKIRGELSIVAFSVAIKVMQIDIQTHINSNIE